ncbi:MAG TPA: arsenite methyltransferase [Phycisphaerales bacterium]|nr:arsenite methyltransferase [Phycisphaerales bacterium]
MTSDPSESIRDTVRRGYAEIARSGSGCCAGPSSCCGSSSPDRLAQAIGYTADELKTLPDGANMGLSCGNPTAIAELKPGQVVLDLGSGGGFDAFIAGPKVGPMGRVIGVDMTPDMVSKARQGIPVYHKHTGLHNVEFRLGEIEHLPLADASVDVVISNCVLNLSPDKPQVWREIGRVLKPGGRVAISDLALLKPLPMEIRDMVESLIGCIAGAVLVDETRAMAEASGLIEIQLTPKPGYVDAMVDWNDPLYRRVVEHLPEGAKAGDYVTSLNITAAKPTLTLTAHIKELIAIGASVTAHCQPCLTYHVDKARQIGIDEQEVREAIAVGHQVEKGSMSAMTAFTKSVLDSSTQDKPVCCTGRTSPDGKSCCS